MLRSTLILTVVCLVAAALLGGAYTLTEEKIVEQQQNALTDALQEVQPNADSFEIKDGYYLAEKGNEIIGYAVVVEQPGYGGIIKMLVGFDTNRTITGLRIMEHEETPGLGANAAKEKFYSHDIDL